MFAVGPRDRQIVWPVGVMPPCSLTVQQCGGPRPAPFMQSRQSRGRPGNTKCLINSLICCDCRAWKACFLAIWGQENPVPCYLHTHRHAHTHIYTQLLLPTIWPTFMCGGGNKDRITLDYLHESTTRGQASYWLLTRLIWTDSKLRSAVSKINNQRQVVVVIQHIVHFSLLPRSLRGGQVNGDINPGKPQEQNGHMTVS